MKVFFYNPSTKTSIWERPHELKNRADVDKMLKAPVSSTSSEEKQDKTEDKTEQPSSNHASESVNCARNEPKREAEDIGDEAQTQIKKFK